MDELSSVFRASSSPRTRRRAITSCDTCRRRKVKCDRNHPICSACRTAGRPCLYNESSVRQLGIHAAAPPGSSRRRGVRNDSPSTTTTTTTSSGVQQRRQRPTSTRLSPSSYDGIDTRLERLESLLERVIHASSTTATAPPPASQRTPVPVAQQQQQQHQQLEEAIDSQQNSRHVSTRASPEQPSPAASTAAAAAAAGPIRAEKDDDGTLLLAQGGSQFVSSHHWSLLATELQDIREILSTDKEPSTPDVFAAAGGHIAQFLPSDAAACYDLLRVFYLYIDPITRLVHKPSLDKRFALFVQEYVNPRWPALDGSEEQYLSAVGLTSFISLEEKLSHDGLLQFRPLAFAIFYTAAHSQAVASGYAEEKRREMATYRKGLELSLLAADFCGSSSLEVLQAYVLLLSCQLRDVTIGRTWPLLSVATRMAIAQGLHREPTLFSPIPSEVSVELRRRIWHQLCYLEWRAAELKGMVSLSAAIQNVDDALTTRVPRNVDDGELSELRRPGLLDARGLLEVEPGRFTDTTFLVGRSRWVQCAKVVAANVQGWFRRTKGGTVASSAAASSVGGGGGGAAAEDEAQQVVGGGDADQRFAEFEKLHRETCALVDSTREGNAAFFRFSYDDPTPLQKLCLMTSRSMEWKCWLTFWCSVPKDFRKMVMTDDARRRVLHESVSLLESLNATTADPTIQGFKWFLEAHSAFQCTFLVLSELQELRFTSPEDSAIRARAIAALKQLVVLHHGDGGGGGPQSSSSSRPWAVIKKYVERLERPAAGEQGGEVSGGGGVDGAGAGAGPMEGVRRTTAADVSADDAAAAAAAAGGFEAAANGMMGAGGFDDDSPSSMMVLPQPFATEEELLQFTFPPGTEWTDPMQDFSLWHVQ